MKKIGLALLLVLFASTASAQIDDRLFADYVRSVVTCCSGRNVVVFYHSKNGDAQSFLDVLGLESRATKQPLDSPAKYRSRMEEKVATNTVAVAYDLDPDAVRILAGVASAKQALSISTTEEDVYTTSLSFDSEAPGRFRSSKVPPCVASCQLNFHLEDKLGRDSSRWRAGSAFLKARDKQLAYKGDRKRMIQAARLLQRALRYQPNEQILGSEWPDAYTPHVRLGWVFLDLASASAGAARPPAKEAQCEAARLEWERSSEEVLQAIAPQALMALREGRQRCPP